MKIRNGFVTNSSSSSFILGFNNEEEIQELNVKDDPYYVQLYSDICRAERHTKQKILETYRNKIKYIADWELRDELEEKHMTYDEVWEFRKTPEYKKMLEEKIQNMVDNLSQKIVDRSIIVSVKYGDGGHGQDGVLEHYIVPKLDCCMAMISHH